MKGPIRSAGKFVLRRLGLHSAVALRRNGALRDDGWFRSFDERRPVDAAGKPLPWLTYPAIELLSRRLRPEMTVFEFGSGWGTLWWASRVRSVIACEHDVEWYRTMSARIPGNVTLLQIDLSYDGDYCRAATKFAEPFDIVVVDGRDRVHCAMQSVAALKKSGVLLWDNSDRDRYQEGIHSLLDQGFRQLELIGLVPGSAAKVETSIFYREGNCLGL